MELEFTPIDITRKNDYIQRLALCEQVASDYSFLNLWGWAGEYGLTWAWDENLVWIKQSRPYEAYWAPVGNWSAVDWSARLETFSDGRLDFIRVPESLATTWTQLLNGRISVEDQRGQWDYLYRAEDLISLRGNRLHKKKNLVTIRSSDPALSGSPDFQPPAPQRTRNRAKCTSLPAWPPRARSV